jgi:hypothetical protein
LLTFSRQLAKQIRSVFRRALQISASQTDQVVWLVGDESGLCFRAQNWRATAEYHLSGPAPTESIPITMEALAACEGTKADELVTVERGSEGVVVLRWTDRSIPQSFQLDAQKIRADQTPVLPEAWASNPPRLLKALCDAMTIAASDATRFAIDCVQLRSDGGRIAATDSHQLLIESGFNFPGNSDLLISRTTLFGFKELPADQPVDVGVTANHGVFRVGAWTFWLTLEKQGRYPNVENIIPAADTAKTRLSLSAEDVSYLLDVVPRLPTETNQDGRVTLDLNGRVALLAKGDGATPITQVVLRNSQRTGDEVRLNTDRRFLVHAAQLGFREIELREPESPVVCRDERRVYLWSVLADGPVLEAGPDTVQLESPLAPHPTRPARAVPSPRRSRPTPERNSTPMPRNRIAETLAGSAPSNGDSPPPAPPTNGEHDGSGTFNAILQQAETAKTALHDAFSQMSCLIGLLKRHRRQSKLMQSTLASLKQLQTLDV